MVDAHRGDGQRFVVHAGSHPIMTGIITRRKQVGDHAVSPVVIFGEHPRARSERSEKRKENQRQQDSQS